MNKRAVIYCRVSTTSDSQTESLEKQIIEAKEAVRELNFELTDCFIDEGRTGTTKETRREYLRMLSEIELGKFDVIVTKSLDRMNRNILDFYLFLDLILRNDVRLYFYLERTYYKTDDKLIIGIKAILAEEYSRELSKKLCSAHAKRQERGEVVMLGSRTYGYQKELQPDGKRQVVIVEEEAEMIHRIFDYCLEGYGARAIAGLLYEEGYRNRNKNAITESTIRRIIRNPLVTGTMIMNRVKRDFNAKKVLYTASEEWIWTKNAVPPIIMEEEWKRANQMMDERSKNILQNGRIKGQGRNTGTSEISGKLICGLCHRPYYRIKGKNGKPDIWKCSNYLKFGTETKGGAGGCCGLPVEEPVLMKALEEAGRIKFPEQKKASDLIKNALEVIETISKHKDSERNREDCRKKMKTVRLRQEVLLEKYLDGKIPDALYQRSELRLKEEKAMLEREVSLLEAEAGDERECAQRKCEIETFLKDGGFSQARALALLGSVREIEAGPLGVTIFFKESEEAEAVNKVTVLFAADKMKYRREAIEYSKERILELIKDNPFVTHSCLAAELGIGKRTAYSRTKELEKEGRIKLTGQGRGRHYIIAEESESSHIS